MPKRERGSYKVRKYGSEGLGWVHTENAKGVPGGVYVKNGGEGGYVKIEGLCIKANCFYETS